MQNGKKLKIKSNKICITADKLYLMAFMLHRNAKKKNKAYSPLVSIKCIKHKL